MVEWLRAKAWIPGSRADARPGVTEAGVRVGPVLHRGDKGPH
jgi:hypothetical protein